MFLIILAHLLFIADFASIYINLHTVAVFLPKMITEDDVTLGSPMIYCEDICLARSYKRHCTLWICGRDLDQCRLTAVMLWMCNDLL